MQKKNIYLTVSQDGLKDVLRVHKTFSLIVRLHMLPKYQHEADVGISYWEVHFIPLVPILL